MTADIESLPGKGWNAHAALADAINRLPIGAPCIIMWINEDESIGWSAHATNMETVWMAQRMIKDIA